MIDMARVVETLLECIEKLDDVVEKLPATMPTQTDKISEVSAALHDLTEEDWTA